MTVPDYQSMMAPLLKALGDGGDRWWIDVKDALAAATGVSEADRAELLPSGRQSAFDNRAGWAATYLSQAGLASVALQNVLIVVIGIVSGLVLGGVLQGNGARAAGTAPTTPATVQIAP